MTMQLDDTKVNEDQAFGSIESDLMQMNLQVSEQADLSVDLQSAFESTLYLNQIKVSVESLNTAIAQNSATFKIITQALNKANEKVGIESYTLGLPKGVSLESDEVKIDKTLALEQIDSSLKRIWQAIVNSIKQAVKSVIEFFKNLFNINKRVNAEATELLGTYKNQKVLSIGHDTFKTSAASTEDYDSEQKPSIGLMTIRYLFSDKTDAPTLMRNYSNLEKLSNDFNDKIVLIESMVETATRIIKAFDDHTSLTGVSFPVITKGLTAVKETGYISNHYTKEFISDELPGGYALKVQGVPADKVFKGLDGIVAIGKTSIGITKYPGKEANADFKGIPVLNQHTAIALLEKTITITHILDTLQEKEKKLETQLTHFASALEGFTYYKDPDSVPDSDKISVTHIKAMATALNSLGTHGVSKVISHVLRTSKAVSDYCRLSTKQWVMAKG